MPYSLWGWSVFKSRPLRQPLWSVWELSPLIVEGLDILPTWGDADRPTCSHLWLPPVHVSSFERDFSGGT